MNFEKDDVESSGALRLKKSYATSFEGAHIQTVIVGDYVFEKVDKKPEDVLYATHENETRPAPIKEHPGVFTKDRISGGIQAIKEYFWGNCCFALIYCALRDGFNYIPVKSDFENDMRIISAELKLAFTCPKNTIASAFSYHRDLNLHMDKWIGRGMKSRNFDFAKKFIDAINRDNK